MLQRSLFDQPENDQTSFALDGRAKATQWLESVAAWLTSEADCGARSAASWENLPPVGFLERTSPEFCRSTEGGIGLPSSGTWQNWGMGPPTAFVTLSGSEWPSDAAVCSLSDVLETGDVPEKYFLSPKACRGILRRAAKRGRELPPALHEALTAVAAEATPDEDEKTISTSSIV